MREELNHKKIAPLEGIFLILGMVVALGIVVFGIGFLAYLLKLQILTVASVVLLTVGATILMRKRLQNYSYTVARGMLVLQRCLGANGHGNDGFSMLDDGIHARHGAKPYFLI